MNNYQILFILIDKLRCNPSQAVGILTANKGMCKTLEDMGYDTPTIAETLIRQEKQAGKVWPGSKCNYCGHAK